MRSFLDVSLDQKLIDVGLLSVRVWVKTVLGSHFGDWVNSPPILGPILVVGLVEVHCGHDLAFDPWPCIVWDQQEEHHGQSDGPKRPRGWKRPENCSPAGVSSRNGQASSFCHL